MSALEGGEVAGGGTVAVDAGGGRRDADPRVGLLPGGALLGLEGLDHRRPSHDEALCEGAAHQVEKPLLFIDNSACRRLRIGGGLRRRRIGELIFERRRRGLDIRCD